MLRILKINSTKQFIEWLLFRENKSFDEMFLDLFLSSELQGGAQWIHNFCAAALRLIFPQILYTQQQTLKLVSRSL